MNTDALILENIRRGKEMSRPFNPITGIGSPLERVCLSLSDHPIPEQHIPVGMMDNPLVSALSQYGTIRSFLQQHLKTRDTSENRETVLRQLIRIRNRYDFPYWAYSFVKIKNKSGGQDIPFKLNRPQRILLERLENMRLSGKPIRLILLKARQWGGSTLIQIYMAWIQLCHKTGWNSIVVAHLKDASIEVKGMFTKLMENYPTWLLYAPGEPFSENAPKLTGFERALNIDIIPQRNCKIKIGSAEKPDSARGGDTAMAHCTEVAFWTKTENKTPEQIVRSACSGILYSPLTIEVFESTANGTGNYFYEEWLRAKEGTSDKAPLFISWFDIEKYALPVDDPSTFAQDLLLNKDNEKNNGRYDWWLWEKGATFEAINWYRHNRKRFSDHADMAAEYPSDDIEAFKHSGRKVFDIYQVENLRKNVRPPVYVGEVSGQGMEGKEALKDLSFAPDKNGNLKIWELPDSTQKISDRYLTVVDVGGRSSSADYSDILVLDRHWMLYGDKPEVVAEWHGHIDHDLLAWKSAQIAAFYNRSLLVIESNTLETKDQDRDLDGDQTGFILNQIASVYPNLYARKQSEEDIIKGIPRKWGFHTNTSTKPMIISFLIKVIRESLYVERNEEALNEYLTYEKKRNGSFGAIEGKHDDCLMARAIGLHICYNEMRLPRIIESPQKVKTPQKTITEATL